MKFSIAKEHLSFFYKNNYIEFESLISQRDITILKEEVPKLLALRLGIEEHRLNAQPPHLVYTSGFDSWRGSEKIKKILLRPHLGEIAAALVKSKKLRIGFDHAFYKMRCAEKEPPCFMKNRSLAALACVQGIACGLMLHVDGITFQHLANTSLTRNEAHSVIPLPQKAGNGIFFLHDAPLSLTYLASPSVSLFQILIAYARETALYRYSEDHANTHAYKRLGYVFGDPLQRDTHPFIYGR